MSTSAEPIRVNMSAKVEFKIDETKASDVGYYEQVLSEICAAVLKQLLHYKSNLKESHFKVNKSGSSAMRLFSKSKGVPAKYTVRAELGRIHIADKQSASKSKGSIVADLSVSKMLFIQEKERLKGVEAYLDGFLKDLKLHIKMYKRRGEFPVKPKLSHLEGYERSKRYKLNIQRQKGGKRWIDIENFDFGKHKPKLRISSGISNLKGVMSNLEKKSKKRTETSVKAIDKKQVSGNSAPKK